MNKPTAFTLIELLIVVAIIGVLAAIAVPNFINAQIRAKCSRAFSEERSIESAYMTYFMDNNAWPPHFDGPAQHRFLTTPISYLTTSVADVFAQNEPAKKDPLWQNTWGQYHAEPSMCWNKLLYGYENGVKNDPDYFANNSNASFFLLSFGPDADLDSPRPAAGRYDSSNGVVSNGDILRPIQGQLREGYPYTELIDVTHR
ncbi:MAG: prepilin-type N-terminal cleavage/methylation domain-containing protein [Candidatus Omnitrophota bacterium]